MRKDNAIHCDFDYEEMNKFIQKEGFVSFKLKTLENSLLALGVINPLDIDKMVAKNRIQLDKIEFLYCDGRYEEAEKLYEEIGQFVTNLEIIYPESKMDGNMRELILVYHALENTFLSRPLYGRELRLAYILDCIKEIDTKDRTKSADKFVKRWSLFSFLCDFNPRERNKEDIAEFQSSAFVSEMEEVFSTVPIAPASISLSRLTEEDIEIKYHDLLDCVNWAKDRQMLDEEVDPLLCNDNYTAEDLVPDDIFKLIDITLSHQQV